MSSWTDKDEFMNLFKALGRAPTEDELDVMIADDDTKPGQL